MRGRLRLAGWATLIGFPLLGALVLFLFDEPVLETMFRSRLYPLFQIVIGAAVGTLLGFAAKWVITSSVLLPRASKYAKLMQSLRLKSGHIFFLSFCAGFGEELLFRGALQPLVGVWAAAVVFVAIHGYLNPMNWRISLYGIYITLAIALLGYMADWWGILTACVAHMAIDIILFRFLQNHHTHDVHAINDAI